MSWVGSLINAGALFGALIGGLLMDRLGRKTVLLILSVPYVISWLLVVLAVDPSKFLLLIKILNICFLTSVIK